MAVERRYIYSSDLLDNPFKAGDPAHDKIFVLGRVDETKYTVTISVEKNTPTYALNAKVLTQFGLNIPTAAEVQKKEGIPGNLSLITGGAIIWITAQGRKPVMPLLRRDEGAPHLAGYLTCPQGRCGENPLETSLKECAEELLLLENNHLVLPPAYKGIPSHSWKALKRQQLAEKAEDLASTGVDTRLALASTPAVLQRGGIERDSRLYKRITVVNDGKVIARYQAFPVRSAAYNALEVNVICHLPVRLGKGQSIESVVKGLDAEPFGRRFGLYGEDELRDEKIMPTLHGYFAARGARWAQAKPMPS